MSKEELIAKILDLMHQAGLCDGAFCDEAIDRIYAEKILTLIKENPCD